MNPFFSSIAGFISGALGAMGLGGGGILVIYLTLFSNISQTNARGINLIFFTVMAFIAVIIYSHKKLIDWKITIPISLAGTIGAIIGFQLSLFIDSHTLSKLFGLLLLLIGIKQIFKKKQLK